MTGFARRTVRTPVPALLRSAVSFEIGLWRSLYRWTLRRPLALGAGGEAFSYAAAMTPIICAFIAVSAVEIPAVHLLLPWQTARLIALALGVQGLFWMVGLLASLRVHPHIVNDAGLRIRHGSRVDITIPWGAIAAIGTRSRYLSSGRTVQIDRTGADLILSLVILSQTNVDVALRHPTTISLPKGSSEPITELRFYADDPGALVARARENLTAGR